MKERFKENKSFNKQKPTSTHSHTKEKKGRAYKLSVDWAFLMVLSLQR